MDRTLKKLYRDHAHLLRLTDLLQLQLDELAQTDRPAFDLLIELVSYIRDYADTIHHPIEDHLYQVMLGRTDKGREHMERLLGDHLVITNMTREFRQALEALRENRGISRDEVEKIGREYLEQQREHMQFEESTAFPLLREELGPEDFDYAKGALPADEDPLLDPNMEARYPGLFQYMGQNKDQA